MGFEHVGEVLHHPLRKFKLEEKQSAVSAVIRLLWIYWDQNLGEWIKTNDIGNMYVSTLQREQITETLLALDTGVFGRTS